MRFFIAHVDEAGDGVVPAEPRRRRRRAPVRELLVAPHKVPRVDDAQPAAGDGEGDGGLVALLRVHGRPLRYLQQPRLELRIVDERVLHEGRAVARGDRGQHHRLRPRDGGAHRLGGDPQRLRLPLPVRVLRHALHQRLERSRLQPEAEAARHALQGRVVALGELQRPHDEHGGDAEEVDGELAGPVRTWEHLAAAAGHEEAGGDDAQEEGRVDADWEWKRGKGPAGW